MLLEVIIFLRVRARKGRVGPQADNRITGI